MGHGSLTGVVSDAVVYAQAHGCESMCVSVHELMCAIADMCGVLVRMYLRRHGFGCCVHVYTSWDVNTVLGGQGGITSVCNQWMVSCLSMSKTTRHSHGSWSDALYRDQYATWPRLIPLSYQLVK